MRIASLLASGTEIAYALGLGDQVVAVSHECDFPAEVANKPRVTRANIAVSATSAEIDAEVKSKSQSGQALYEIDVDAMAALKVDFIITQSQCEVCAVNFDDVMQAVHTREELKGARVVSLNPNSLDSIFADIARVAEVTSKAEIHAAADRVINALKDRLKRLSEITRLHGRRRVACLEWIDPVMLAANWIPEIIDAAGGECHLVAPGTPSQYASWSDIVAFDPEFIILMPCGFDLDRAAAEARALADDAGFPGFFDLSAVRNDRVFAVDANAYFTRPGPRVVDSAEIVGHLLHPESVALPPGANLFRRLNVADKSDRQIGMGQ